MVDNLTSATGGLWVSTHDRNTPIADTGTTLFPPRDYNDFEQLTITYLGEGMISSYALWSANRAPCMSARSCGPTTSRMHSRHCQSIGSCRAETHDLEFSPHLVQRAPPASHRSPAPLDRMTIADRLPSSVRASNRYTAVARSPAR